MKMMNISSLCAASFYKRNMGRSVDDYASGKHFEFSSFEINLLDVYHWHVYGF